MAKTAIPIISSCDSFSLNRIEPRIEVRTIVPPKTIGVTIPTLFVAKLLLRAMVKSAIDIPPTIAKNTPNLNSINVFLFKSGIDRRRGNTADTEFTIPDSKTEFIVRDASVPISMAIV